MAEGPGFNVFAVSRGALTTPDRGVPPGITRRCVFDLCEELGLPVSAAPLSVEALRSADEVFITSTAGGIMPVSWLDGRPLGTGKVGPITRLLTEAYWRKHEDPSWSSPVDYPAS